MRRLDNLVQAGLERLAREAGARYADVTLDTFPAAHPAQRHALAQARRYLAGDGSAFAITGPSGRGKTGLVVATARELIAAHPGIALRFLVVRDYLAQLRRDIAAGDTPDVAEAAATEVLVLDDLGAERPTTWAIETIGALVDSAYRDDVRTIFTSNYRPAALAERLTLPDDPHAGERIVSRLLDDAVVADLPDGAPDLRLGSHLHVVHIEETDS